MSMKNPLFLQSTGSTNDDAFKLALKGAKHGFGVLTTTQHGGKGRLGKDWISPVGTGLYCSIVLRPDLPFSQFPQITLTAGLALCKVVECLLPNVPFGLKWPNDLYSNGCKCAGILVESSNLTDGEDMFAIVGIGINVNTSLEEFPSELKKTATSLRILSGKAIDIIYLYRRVHDVLLEQVERLVSSGFDGILEDWRKRDVLMGKEMQWVTCDKQVITARAMGPDKNGQLLATDSSGKVYEILSGDVQLVDGDMTEIDQDPSVGD